MAVVFRARHEKLGIPVAVKAMSTSSPVGDVERFKREARVGMRLAHPGCVKVYDFGEVDAFYYMIQEFVEGEDLRERIRRRQRFKWWDAIRTALEIAETVQYIHANGVIHRDLKPANIFLPWRGGIKIGDFGLATEGDDQFVDDERLTMAGLAIGSPAYMPPEQFRDTSSVDERGDLYSLGITMFELLTGEPPFRSKKVAALRDMHLNNERPRPSERVHGVPGKLDNVVLKLIERDPLDRYQSAQKLITDLEQLARDLKIDQIADGNTTRSRRTTRTFKTVIVPNGVGLQEVDESVPDSDVVLPPGYRLLHPISKGPAWSNYLAHHIDSGHDLVLWLLERSAVPEDAPDRIQADLLRIGAANVRGFNGAIAVGEIEDKIFAASFQNEGKSFTEIMADEGMLEQVQAVSLIQDLNRTLRPLHEANIFLRGIRPDRLYRDSSGKTSVDAVATILCDEGLVPLSKFKDAKEIAYLSPERHGQALRQGSISADVFSIGSVLYRLMTGASIHEEHDPVSFSEAVKSRKVATLREVLGGRCSRAISDAVKRCLVPTPSRRFQSLEALSLALKGRNRPTPSGRFTPKPATPLNSFIGLDVGNANSRVAMLGDDAYSQLVVGPDGHREIPSAVFISKRSPVLVGQQALVAARKNPKYLGLQFTRGMINKDSRENPIIYGAFVIEQLLRQCAADGQSRPEEAVLAVPNMLGERERYALRLAGELAGVKVLGLIPSPTAAALSFGLSPQSRPTRALILDIGCQSMSVSIIEVRHGNLQVLAADGLNNFGGQSWNDRICQMIAREIEKITGQNPLNKSLNRLFLEEQVENAKKILSTRNRARVLVAAGSKVRRTTLERSKMEERTRDLLQRIASLLESVLEKSNLAWNSIDRVFSVGGSSRMPALTKLIWKVTGRIPDATLDHTACMAEGANYYALKLKNQRGDYFVGNASKIARKILIRNVSTYSLGVVLDTPHGQTLSHVIIPDQSPLPAKVTKIFGLIPDQRGTVRIRLVEGDPQSNSMRTLGVCKIRDVVAGDNQPARISTTYSLTEDGTLFIEAVDSRTGQPYKVVLDRLIPDGQSLRTRFRELSARTSSQ